MALIIVTGQEAATNTDILQGTRLQTIGPGVLTIDVQASDNVAANNYTASVQLASGKTPMNAVRVPAGAATGLAGVLDDREKLSTQFIIRDTGHTVFSCIETGDTELTWQVSHQSLA